MPLGSRASLSAPAAAYCSSSSASSPPQPPEHPQSLHSAAASGDPAAVRSLLESYASKPSILAAALARSLHGVLPLHAAVSSGSEHIVALLLSYGADANALLYRPLLLRPHTGGGGGGSPALPQSAGPDKEGRTALHLAAVSGHRNVIAILLQHGANPDAKDDRGLTPEMLALATGHDLCAEILRKAAAGPATVPVVPAKLSAVRGGPSSASASSNNTPTPTSLLPSSSGTSKRKRDLSSLRIPLPIEIKDGVGPSPVTTSTRRVRTQASLDHVAAGMESTFFGRNHNHLASPSPFATIDGGGEGSTTNAAAPSTSTRSLGQHSRSANTNLSIGSALLAESHANEVLPAGASAPRKSSSDQNKERLKEHVISGGKDTSKGLINDLSASSVVQRGAVSGGVDSIGAIRSSAEIFPCGAAAAGGGGGGGAGGILIMQQSGRSGMAANKLSHSLQPPHFVPIPWQQKKKLSTTITTSIPSSSLFASSDAKMADLRGEELRICTQIRDAGQNIHLTTLRAQANLTHTALNEILVSLLKKGKITKRRCASTFQHARPDFSGISQRKAEVDAVLLAIPPRQTSESSEERADQRSTDSRNVLNTKKADALSYAQSLPPPIDVRRAKLLAGYIGDILVRAAPDLFSIDASGEIRCAPDFKEGAAYAPRLHQEHHSCGLSVWANLIHHAFSTNRILCDIILRAAARKCAYLDAKQVLDAALGKMGEMGEEKGGIYILTPDGEHVYVGQTQDFRQREKTYLRNAVTNGKMRAVVGRWEMREWARLILLQVNNIPALVRNVIETAVNALLHANAATNLNVNLVDQVPEGSPTSQKRTEPPTPPTHKNKKAKTKEEKREEINRRQREYYAKLSPEQIKERNRRRRERNKNHTPEQRERRQSSQRRYQAKLPPKQRKRCNDRRRAYQAKLTPKQIEVYNHRQRERKKNLTPAQVEKYNRRQRERKRERKVEAAKAAARIAAGTN
ncbi:hypothetical protein CF319_g5690 [Tilletia indica]|nr:hypothetical protein CF319_g5690 [Tilletia indica]